jgi:hypothetical protein
MRIASPSPAAPLADDGQPAAPGPGADREAVHRAVGERRQVDGRRDVLREHAAERVRGRDVLARERAGVCKNGVARLVDREHRAHFPANGLRRIRPHW